MSTDQEKEPKLQPGLNETLTEASSGGELLKPDAGEVAGGSVDSSYSLYRLLAVKLVFVLLAVLAFTGVLDRASDKALSGVWEHNEVFLEKSLKHATVWTVGLAVPKGVLTVLASSEIEPEILQSKLGKIHIGGLTEPFLDIIDDLFDFMAFSLFLIYLQVALLEFIRYSSLQFFLGLGAVFCAVDHRRRSLAGRIGLGLVMLSLTVYVVYPSALFFVSSGYEGYQAEASVRLAENIGVLSERAGDLGFSSENFLSNSVKNVRLYLDIVEGELSAVWEAFSMVFIGFILMFILTPMVTFGLVLFIAKRGLEYLDMYEGADRLDRTLKSAAGGLVARRSLKRFLK